MFILRRQKKAWQAYGKSKKLRYKPGKTLANPELKGMIQEYTVGVFTGEHVSPDMRGSRKLTAVEINLTSVMPVAGGVASGGMVPLLQGMGFKEEMRPDHQAWDKSYIAAADNRYALKAYLTDERLAVLTDLMKIKNAWITYVFRGDVTLLRLDTPDPLDSEQKLDQIIKKMIDSAKALELKAGEGSRLKSEEVRKPDREKALEVDEAKIAGSTLTLEDDAH